MLTFCFIYDIVVWCLSPSNFQRLERLIIGIKCFPFIFVFSSPSAARISDAPWCPSPLIRVRSGGRGRKCQRWTWLGGGRACVCCVFIVSSTDTGWWVGCEHVREKRRNQLAPHISYSEEYECFVQNLMRKITCILVGNIYAFWGWYLTLIWHILFHFLAVSVYDEGAVCNITLSLYHYGAGSLNTDTQQPGGINAEHKRGI